MGCIGRQWTAPHDLLALGPDGPAALAHATGSELPSWAVEALERAPWVVVRRAEALNGLIPVGIRGRTRGERYAAYLPSMAVEHCVQPEDLAVARTWRAYACGERSATAGPAPHPAVGLPHGAGKRLHQAERLAVGEGAGILASLDPVAAICDAWGLTWGPTGSAGFTLASGRQALSATSDLDLLIRASHPLALTEARDLFRLLASAAGATRLDIQMETPAGSVALAEYMRGKAPVLLRTGVGPRLVTDLCDLWA